MLLQRKKGIQTDQIAKRKKRDKIFYTKLIMKIATYTVVLAEIVSILAVEPDLPSGIMMLGAVLGIAGNIINFFSVCGCYAAFADITGGKISADSFWTRLGMKGRSGNADQK